jgi:hypothetical protein
MLRLKEPKLSSYAIWKLLTTIFFFSFCINWPGNFYDKMPTLLIFFQLITIEALISARFDGIIE